MSLKAEIAGAKRAVKHSLKTDKPEVIEPRYDIMRKSMLSNRQQTARSNRGQR